MKKQLLEKLEEALDISFSVRDITDPEERKMAIRVHRLLFYLFDIVEPSYRCPCDYCEKQLETLKDFIDKGGMSH